LRPDGSNLGVLGEINSFAKQGLLNKGSAASALHSSLVVGPNDLCLDKPRFGAFHATDLELILRSRGIDTVIITGIATNVCCETTAREASVRDFRVFFLSDATATFDIGEVSAAEIQRATCATISLVFGQVLTTEEMIGKIEAGS
jgi:nicotinamidase-related amidase